MVGQKKARAWRARQAVATARQASPVHGRHAAVAPWRGRDATRGNGTAQRWGRPDAALGWARRGAGLGQTPGARAASAAQAGPASAVGRERRRRPAKGENIFF